VFVRRKKILFKQYTFAWLRFPFTGCL
jgi:hypothetical protein